MQPSSTGALNEALGRKERKGAKVAKACRQEVRILCELCDKHTPQRRIAQFELRPAITSDSVASLVLKYDPALLTLQAIPPDPVAPNVARCTPTSPT